MGKNSEDYREEYNAKFGKGILEKLRNRSIDDKTLEDIRKYYNPDKSEVGDFTGRCLYCHSDDLWDDMGAYGCNPCEAIYFF